MCTLSSAVNFHRRRKHGGYPEPIYIVGVGYRMLVAKHAIGT